MMAHSSQTLCSIPNCDKAQYAKDLCQKHYMRLFRHGDPLAGRTPDGELLKFYNEVVLQFDGDECLIWPFGRTNGYGQIKRDGRTRLVHRILCEDAYGPPPTPEHQAAHSCGKGHLGCVNKHHLSWKTPKENQADRIIHGTHSRGENNAVAKLTEDQAREIIGLTGHLSRKQIAEKFGVSAQNISSIQTGKAWAWLKQKTTVEQGF